MSFFKNDIKGFNYNNPFPKLSMPVTKLFNRNTIPISAVSSSELTLHSQFKQLFETTFDMDTYSKEENNFLTGLCIFFIENKSWWIVGDIKLVQQLAYNVDSTILATVNTINNALTSDYQTCGNGLFTMIQ